VGIIYSRVLERSMLERGMLERGYAQAYARARGFCFLLERGMLERVCERFDDVL
jgi:hypothetical protein